MSAAQPSRAGSNVDWPRLAALFGSEKRADCEVAFVRKGDPDGPPLLVLPGHMVIHEQMVDFFMAQARLRACSAEDGFR
jgi:hypothetical protein